jgi:hypothetical protein
MAQELLLTLADDITSTICTAQDTAAAALLSLFSVGEFTAV